MLRSQFILGSIGAFIPHYLMGKDHWIPNKYKKEAVQYYDALDADQWEDVFWHAKAFGVRNAVFAGTEGSNRPRGRHGEEDSWQDVGIYYGTARIYFPAQGLRGHLRDHTFAATLSAEIDAGNLTMELHRSTLRPALNAAMRYPGGSNWRNRLGYGLTFMARYSELERRLIIAKKNGRF